MLDWQRERDGLVVVGAAVLLALFLDDLLGALAPVRDWGPALLGAGALALAGVFAYRTWASYSATRPRGVTRRAALPEHQTTAASAPGVAVERWRVEGDELSVDLSNVGAGAATELTAVVERGEALTARTRLGPTDGRTRALAAGQEGRTFAAEPVFRGAVDGRDVAGVYSAVAETLRAADTDRVRGVVAVEYVDPAGDRHRRRVWAGDVTLEGTLSEAVEESAETVSAEGLPPE